MGVVLLNCGNPLFLAFTSLGVVLYKFIVFGYVSFEITEVLDMADAVFGKLLRVEVEDCGALVQTSEDSLFPDVVALLLAAALGCGLSLAIP